MNFLKVYHEAFDRLLSFSDKKKIYLGKVEHESWIKEKYLHLKDLKKFANLGNEAVILRRLNLLVKKRINFLHDSYAVQTIKHYL